MHNLNIHLQESNKQLQKAITNLKRCEQLKTHPAGVLTLCDQLKSVQILINQIQQRSDDLRRIIDPLFGKQKHVHNPIPGYTTEDRFI